jgi:hypothetical protein
LRTEGIDSCIRLGAVADFGGMAYAAFQ